MWFNTQFSWKQNIHLATDEFYLVRLDEVNVNFYVSALIFFPLNEWKFKRFCDGGSMTILCSGSHRFKSPISYKIHYFFPFRRDTSTCTKVRNARETETLKCALMQSKCNLNIKWKFLHNSNFSYSGRYTTLLQAGFGVSIKRNLIKSNHHKRTTTQGRSFHPDHTC